MCENSWKVCTGPFSAQRVSLHQEFRNSQNLSSNLDDQDQYMSNTTSKAWGSWADVTDPISSPKPGHICSCFMGFKLQVFKKTCLQPLKQIGKVTLRVWQEGQLPWRHQWLFAAGEYAAPAWVDNISRHDRLELPLATHHTITVILMLDDATDVSELSFTLLRRGGSQSPGERPSET